MTHHAVELIAPSPCKKDEWYDVPLYDAKGVVEGTGRVWGNGKVSVHVLCDDCVQDAKKFGITVTIIGSMDNYQLGHCGWCKAKARKVYAS